MNFKKLASTTADGLRIGLTTLALLQFSLGAPVANAQNDTSSTETRTPIKHVIVIIGENRTFDHIFATYQPRRGEVVDNLLSKGIINIDGTPGPNFNNYLQYSANNPSKVYSISPPKGPAYNQVNNKLQAPGTSYAFQAPYSDWKLAAWDGPGALTTLEIAAQAEYGLAPQDLPLLPVLLSPDRWLLWLGLLFIASVYFFPTGVVGRLRNPSRPAS